MPSNLLASLGTWAAGTHADGSDSDGTPDPERRDDYGDPPPEVTDPGAPPFAEQEPDPPAHPAAQLPTPLPVKILGPVEIVPARDWQIGTVVVGTTPVRIANAEPDRLTISVTNRGAATVYVAAHGELVAADSTRGQIKINETRTWGHTAEIWAQCDAAEATVEITSERR